MIVNDPGLVQAERERVAAALRAEGRSKARWVPHIYSEGARFHVLSWDTHGAHCSEPRCEMNRPHAKPRR